jgi:hypothetical protein
MTNFCLMSNFTSLRFILIWLSWLVSLLLNSSNAIVRWRIADTKSANLIVPSRLMYLKLKIWLKMSIKCRQKSFIAVNNRKSISSYFKINIERMSVLSWNPTSHRASRNLSALKIPVFSFVCILNTPCL